MSGDKNSQLYPKHRTRKLSPVVTYIDNSLSSWLNNRRNEVKKKELKKNNLRNELSLDLSGINVNKK